MEPAGTFANFGLPDNWWVSPLTASSNSAAIAEIQVHVFWGSTVACLAVSMLFAFCRTRQGRLCRGTYHMQGMHKDSDVSARALEFW